jgi:hypothetical protein
LRETKWIWTTGFLTPFPTFSLDALGFAAVAIAIVEASKEWG